LLFGSWFGLNPDDLKKIGVSPGKQASQMECLIILNTKAVSFMSEGVRFWLDGLSVLLHEGEGGLGTVTNGAVELFCPYRARDYFGDRDTWGCAKRLTTRLSCAGLSALRRFGANGIMVGLKPETWRDLLCQSPVRKPTQSQGFDGANPSITETNSVTCFPPLTAL
jgi:hypothetical protein